MRSKTKIRSCIAVLGTVVGAILVMIAVSTPVQAAANAAAAKKVYKKALLNGLSTCYADKYMQKEVSASDFSKTKNDLISGTAVKTDNLLTRKGVDDKPVLVPTDLTISSSLKTAESGKVSCRTVFKTLASLTKKTKAIANMDNPEKLGYTIKYSSAASGESRENCFSIVYNIMKNGESTGIKQTNAICLAVDKDGEIVTPYDDVQNGKAVRSNGVARGGDVPSIDEVKKAEAEGTLDELQKKYNTGDLIPLGDYRIAWVDAGLAGGIRLVNKNNTKEPISPSTFLISYEVGDKWSEFTGDLLELTSKNGIDSDGISLDDGYILKTIRTGYDIQGESDRVESWTRQSNQDGRVAAAKFFLGAGTLPSGWDNDSIKYTKQDTFDLGMIYINKYLKKNVISYKGDACGKKKAEVKKVTGHVYQVSKDKWCPIEGIGSTKAQSIKVNMIKGDHTMGSMTLKQVVEELEKSKYDGMSQGDGNAPGVDSDGSGGNDESNPTCYNAAGALGWVACPILDAMSTVVSGIYSYIEDSLLSIDGEQLLASNGSLHEAWGTFRDYANILFVILLALVILSQLTGIGLNNYSIKKMLPRLIVMVVLVNVSFIICQLAVDLSNIGGYGIRKFFTDAANKQGIPDLNMGTFADSLKGVLIGGVGTTVALGATLSIVVSNWETLLIPLALFLLTTIIAIIFFAIVLGVRQAGIVILVALTPIAIICYALPNTKKLFDKWFKLFSALLLVFPICGALMGGGLWASKLLLSTGKGEESFFFALVAMLLQVVPFFLVPSLVRGSLSVAGNIGTKISRAGSNIGGFASRQIRASEGVKDFQQRMGVHNAERKYKRIEAGKGIRGRIANNRFIGDTRLGRAAQSSMNRSARRYAGMVNKQTRDDIASEVGVNLIGDDERQSMLLNEMTERSQERMSNDIGFMNDLAEQKKQYSGLLDQIEQDPSNLQARADARALSSLMMKNFKGKGRDAVKNALSKRAYDHQQNDEAIGEGLASVANNLLQDNPTLKGDDGGLHALVNNMAKGGKEAFEDTRFRFVAADPNIKGSEDSYYSAQYDATEAVGDFSAETLGKGNKRMLERVANALASGEVDEKTAATYSRLASQALSDPRINVPSENVDVLNQIMHNSAQSMGTNFLANNATSLTDTSTGAVYTAAGGGRFTNGGNDYEYDAESGSLRQVGNPEHTVDVNKLRMNSKNYITDDGRRLEHTSGNEYEYHYRDKNGDAKTTTYQRDATTGQFSEVGGSDIIAANKVSKAQDVFKNSTQSGQKYRYQRLENGQSLKVPRQKIQMPRNWTQDASGRWVDISTGNSLTPAQLHQMDMINERNNQIEIDNMEEAANSGGQHH